VVRKTFVLDSNILLQDPDAILRFKESNVVIPVIVLQELDGMKRLSDELDKNARYIMRYIDSLKSKKEGDLSKGFKIENGINVRIHFNIRLSESKPFPLLPDRTIHKILMTAYQLKELGERVVLVSKDFIMRIKAEAIGLEAKDYENFKFSYGQIYKGYRKLEVSKKRSIYFIMQKKELTLQV